MDTILNQLYDGTLRPFEVPRSPDQKYESASEHFELAWEALQWERETEMFLRRGRLRCRALFVAQAEEEGEVFLDFILKGVMTT